MSDTSDTLSERDEQFHDVDPALPSWNESWFFSFVDLDGGPAGFFRLGLLPNQDRAMVWSFVHVDGRWLGVEESRLAFGDFDLSDGAAYDKWDLQFAWHPDPPLRGARFTFSGTALERTGAESGAWVPISIDLTVQATSDAVRTGSGHDDGKTAYPYGRLEQSVVAEGTVVVDGEEHRIRAGAHRDRSWGPREWRVAFTLGDLQAQDRQLYFVGQQFPGLGGGFVREGDRPVEHLVVADGSAIEYDDEGHTLTSGHLVMEGGDTRVEVDLTPVAPSVTFDMAHTCEPPEHWLYYRTLVEARVSGWDGTCRGWFESSRYGIA